MTLWSQTSVFREHSMNQSADQVRFDLVPLRFRQGGYQSGYQGCYIVATHPSGQQEHIDGFHDEAEARQWLDNSRALRAWLRTRGYAH